MNHSRVDYKAAPPGAFKAMLGLETYVRGSGLEHALLELVKTRVSQINGCAHCIDLHTRDLLKTMAADKVALVPVWEEVPYLFSEQYRAALAWAEEVTLVSETHASDRAYAAVSAVFEPKDLVDLTITIAAMNAFNRLGAPFRLPVKAQP